jgi:hypothetical protein
MQPHQLPSQHLNSRRATIVTNETHKTKVTHETNETTRS